MKRVFVVSVFLLAAAFVLPAAVCAQVTKRPSRAAMDSLLNPALAPNAAKIVRFDKIKENIGLINESDSARTVLFAFRNVSDKAVSITRVTTHCGCTAAAYEKGPVAPGATSVIAVRYNPKGRAGTIDTNAFVYTSCSGNKPVAKLTILGVVVDNDEWSHLPCVMGALRLKRTTVSFAGGRTIARIPCANTGCCKPLELKARLLPSYACFSTEPQLLQPGEEGDIVISIDSTAAGTAKRFSLLIDGVEGDISSRTIKAIIE